MAEMGSDGLTIPLRCIRIIQDMNIIPGKHTLSMNRNLQRVLIRQKGHLWLYLLVSMGLVSPLMRIYPQTAKDRKSPGIDLTRIKKRSKR